MNPPPPPPARPAQLVRAERRERYALAILASLVSAIRGPINEQSGPALITVSVDWADALIVELDQRYSKDKP